MSVYNYLDNPSARQAGNIILNSLEQEKVITIQGYSSVYFDGVTVSKEPVEGHFIILLKPDGTTLVHSNENYKPLNWQDSGSEISVSISEDTLQIVSVSSDNQKLEIDISEVYGVSILQAMSSEELEMQGTEEDMHNYIMNHPFCIEDGFTALKNEKEFDFGRVDIYGKDSNSNPVIIEVKRRQITRSHINQLYTYVLNYSELYDREPRGILVAPTCSNYLLDSLTDYGLEYVSLDPSEVF